MNIAYSDGSVVTDYPLLEEDVITHVAKRIVVDSGVVKIDSANHTLDEAHLVLDGVLTSGQDYFKITRQGVKLLNADYVGKLHCNADISAPIITTHNTKIAEVESGLITVVSDLQTILTEIGNATHLPTINTLVRRDQTTHFDNLVSNVIDISTACALYGDGALTYTPQDQNGTNIPGYTYRFGRNTDELGDFTGIGNGLEFKEPNNSNEILIQTNQTTPTIEMQVNKTLGSTPYILARGTDDAKMMALDAEGCHVKNHQVAFHTMIPGVTINHADLHHGSQTFRYVLGSTWGSNTPETKIYFTGTHSLQSGVYRHIQNLEICVDDYGFGGNVLSSQIYVDRWSVYRNQYQYLYVVLKSEFLGGETVIPIGTVIRLTFNNKLLL